MFCARISIESKINALWPISINCLVGRIRCILPSEEIMGRVMVLTPNWIASANDCFTLWVAELGHLVVQCAVGVLIFSRSESWSLTTSRSPLSVRIDIGQSIDVPTGKLSDRAVALSRVMIRWWIDMVFHSSARLFSLVLWPRAYFVPMKLMLTPIYVNCQQKNSVSLTQ